jgi:hypothetical protein
MARLMTFFLHCLIKIFSKKSLSTNLTSSENRYFTAGIWYYPPVAGSGGFMLGNPPFSSKGDDFEFNIGGDNV